MKENMIPTVTPKEISEKIKQFCEAISTETKPIYINVVSYDKECMDINQLEIVVFHVTTNGDECAEIKKNGLKDFKMVLQEKTELSTFLYERGIRFDIPSKSMYVNDKAFDIDYSKIYGFR